MNSPNRAFAASLIAVAGIGSIAACGSSTKSASPAPAASTVPVPATLPTSEPGITTGPMGSALTIWADATDTQSVIVASLRDQGDGTWRVNETAKQLQGHSGAPSLSAMTDTGTRVDQEPSYICADDPCAAAGNFDFSGELLPNETRSGWVAFKIPTGQKVVKVYYMYGYQPKAVWNA